MTDQLDRIMGLVLRGFDINRGDANALIAEIYRLRSLLAQAEVDRLNPGTAETE